MHEICCGRAHDTDGNNLLDGLELLAALSHGMERHLDILLDDSEVAPEMRSRTMAIVTTNLVG